MKELIEKLDFEIYKKDQLTKKYNQEKLEFISNEKEFIPGGFFQNDYYKSNPELGKVKWDKKYPKGRESWEENKGDKLTSFGQQKLVDKIDEMIELLNKLNNNQGDKQSDTPTSDIE